MKKLLALIFLAALPSSLLAQAPQPSATPPQPPLLKRAPAPSQWVITYKSGEAAATSSPSAGGTPAAARPKVTLVTKGSELVFENTTDANGQNVQKWHASGVVVTGINGKNWVLAASPGNTFDAPDYSSDDFAGFGWISLKNFVRAQDVMGRHCLVFKDKTVTMDPSEVAVRTTMRANEIADAILARKGTHGKEPPVDTSPLDLSQFSVDVTAYIDDQTRLPMVLVYALLDGGTMTRIYQYQRPPASLSLPPEVQHLIDSHSQREKRMAAGAAHL